MLLISAHTVGSRQKRKSLNLWFDSLLAMACGVSVVMAVTIRLALEGIEPWYEPQTVVPLLGIILGNSVNGVALASERLVSDLRAERDQVELRLTLGASARQAALPALRAAVRAGLTPTINSMLIAGIVSIPGMATGQILAGADVATALQYQVVIYFGITGTVGISILILLGLRLKRYFNRNDQLLMDRLEDH